MTKANRSSKALNVVTSKEAQEIRKAVRECAKRHGEESRRLGEFLYRVKHDRDEEGNTLWKSYGFASFEAYLKAECADAGVGYPTLEKYVRVHEAFAIRFREHADQASRVKLTKLRELTRLIRPKLMNDKNVKRWLNLAESGSYDDVENAVTEAIARRISDPARALEAARNPPEEVESGTKEKNDRPGAREYFPITKAQQAALDWAERYGTKLVRERRTNKGAPISPTDALIATINAMRKIAEEKLSISELMDYRKAAA